MSEADEDDDKDHVLVLTRRIGETFTLIVGERRVQVSVVSVAAGQRARIAITAPGDVHIIRNEVLGRLS